MTDPIEQLADQQMLVLATDLQVQLEKGTATRPVLWLLAKARRRAANAFVMFVDADPEDAKVIRKLQSEVQLYDDMVKACRELMSRGKDADRKIAEDDRSDLEEIVADMSDEQRRLNNIETRGSD